MSLYKIAAKISKKKEKEEAARRAAIGGISGMFLPLIGPSVAGGITGSRVNHGVVGTFFGPAAVNGARAKDTGISTLGTTANTTALIGGGVGALNGLAKAIKAGRPDAALLTTLGGAAAGAAAGAGVGALSYGLGHLLGAKQKIKKHKRKK